MRLSRSSRSPSHSRMAEPVGFAAGGDFGEGLGHAMKAEGVKLVEGRMFEQVVFS